MEKGDLEQDGNHEREWSAILTIPAYNGMIILPNRRIARLEADGSYTNVYEINGSRHVVSRNIGLIHRLLPEEQFFRCHHKHVINLALVERVVRHDGHRLVLTTGQQIEVARRRWHDLLNALGKQ